MSIVTDRRCSRCGQSKPRDQFHRNPRMGDGLSSWCKDCQKASNRAWRAGNGQGYVRGYNAGRRVAHPTIECAGCGISFRAPRRDSRYCCDRCRDVVRIIGHPLIPSAATRHHQLHAVKGDLRP